MAKINSSGNEGLVDNLNKGGQTRRNFLRYAGATGLVATVIASCTKESGPGSGKKGGSGTMINLGSGDVGILNYAYTLEQLEAAFYIRVIETPYTFMAPLTYSRLKDIRDHEICHREFFKTALGSAAIPKLEFDFSSINFTDRDSVLNAAKAFEDTGVSAYNGAGMLLTSPDYLTLAGKIVSVEARHAAYLRDHLADNTFADSTVVGSNGLDTSRTPLQVLAIAGPYIKATIDSSNLPTS